MSIVTDPDDLDRFQVAVDPIAQTISLRGLGTERHAVDITGDSDGTTTFTDAGANFTGDGVVAGDVLTIISDPADDGGIIGHYRVVGSVTATTFVVDRAIPASTAADLTYKINAPQTPGATVSQVSSVPEGRQLQGVALPDRAKCPHRPAAQEFSRAKGIQASRPGFRDRQSRDRSQSARGERAGCQR